MPDYFCISMMLSNVARNHSFAFTHVLFSSNYLLNFTMNLVDLSGNKATRLLNPDHSRKGTKDKVSRILLILDWWESPGTGTRVTLNTTTLPPHTQNLGSEWSQCYCNLVVEFLTRTNQNSIQREPLHCYS